MEFVEEEARPRFLFHSRISTSSATTPETPKLSKLHVAACFVAASILFFSALFFFQSQTLTFILIWTSLSLLVGPFAPTSVTGGDTRVGKGEILEPLDSDHLPEEVSEESKRRIPGRRSRARRSDDLPLNSVSPAVGSVVPEKTDKSYEDPIIISNGSAKVGEGRGKRDRGVVEEKDWTEEDFEVLKKQISKHPVGTSRRWELVAEAFRGRHCVDDVIRTAKSLSEKRPGVGDSFAQFLRQRKPLDKRGEALNGALPSDFLLENGDSKRGGGDESVNWSTGEDIALLNALKVFPKDVSMRWEKIAATVPGKSKACCMRRVAELKRDFRSSKAS